ncbi:hypothetical protein TrCOL_g5724 [Triparma columacea]|uniref:Ubiquitin-like domain-containing protein n=1 Tax=Triparma columacea TaxID=722753 RepID=A0A9W7L508_9STRA|nr:hypothetical protein TrCOL_g5724 [Triparma columacea]
MSDSDSDDDLFTYSTKVVFAKKPQTGASADSSSDSSSDDSSMSASRKEKNSSAGGNKRKRNNANVSLLDSDSDEDDSPANVPQCIIDLDTTPPRASPAGSSDPLSVSSTPPSNLAGGGVDESSINLDSTFTSSPSIGTNEALSKARQARERLREAQNEVVLLDDSSEDEEDDVVEEVVVQVNETPTEPESYGGSKVTLKIRVNGDNKNILTYPTTTLTPFKLMVTFVAGKLGVPEGGVKIILDGDVVGGMGTPEGEDLEDEDIMEAKVDIEQTKQVDQGSGGKVGGVGEKARKGSAVIVSVRRNGNKRQCKKFKVMDTDPVGKIRGGFMAHYKKGKVMAKLWMGGKELNDKDTLRGRGWKGEVLDGMDNGKVPNV